MSNTLYSLETDHQSLIHDSQFDYYGNKLATCGADGKVYIYQVDSEKYNKIGEIEAHDSAIWSLSWAHPRFGGILATAGYDKKVILWVEQGGKWNKLYEFIEHSNSVNCVSFCPQEYGLILACGSSDGKISLIEYKNDQWRSHLIKAHPSGVNCLTWSQYSSKNESLKPFSPYLITGGSDGVIKVWVLDEITITALTNVETIDAHEGSILDVAWTTNHKNDYFVSIGEDGAVVQWIKEEDGISFTRQDIIVIDAPSRVSFSPCGSYLAIISSDGQTLILKNDNETWETVSKSNNDGMMENLADN